MYRLRVVCSPALTVFILAAGAACGSDPAVTANECISGADCDAGQVCFRGSCQDECALNSDCPAGEVCTDGTCVPSGVSTCVSADECTSPPTLCQTATGASCDNGRCTYPAVVCDDPPAPACSADDSTYTTFGAGTCVATTGQCDYAPNPTACPQCSVNCAGACDETQCTEPTANLGCLANPVPVIDNGGVCRCEYQTQTTDNAPCPDDDEDPCTRNARCQSGECVVETIEGESCVDENDDPIDGFCVGGECVECRTTDDCNTDSNVCSFFECVAGACVDRTDTVNGTVCDFPDGVSGGVQPRGECLDGACVECIPGVSDNLCDDGNSCTDSVCGSNNFCAVTPRATGAACALAGDSGGAENGLCTAERQCVACLDQQNTANGSNPACALDDLSNFTDGDAEEVAACHVATCQSNICQPLRLDNGTSCSFTSGGSCQNGWCIRCDGVADAPPSNPPDVDACTDVSVQNANLVDTVPGPGENFAGAVCLKSFAARNGTSCGGGATCFEGNCFNCSQFNPTNTNSCATFVHTSDGALTQAGRCDPGPPRTSGPCNDGDGCTTVDTCNSSGVCQGGSPVSCGTCQVCQSSTGSCVAVPNGTSCSSFYCRIGETCSGGSCNPNSGSLRDCGEATCSESQDRCVCSGAETCGSGSSTECCSSNEICSPAPILCEPDF